MHRFASRVVSLVSVIAVGIGLDVGTALADQSPTPAACSSAPTGTSCVVVTGSSDHDGVPVRKYDSVHYTFTVQNLGDTDTTAPEIDLHVWRGYFDFDVRLDGVRVRFGRYTTTTDIRVLGPLNLPAGGPPHIITATARINPGRYETLAYATVGSSRSNDVVSAWPHTDFLVAAQGAVMHRQWIPGRPVYGAYAGATIYNRGTQDRGARLTVSLPAGWHARLTNPRSGDSCHYAAPGLVCTLAPIRAFSKVYTAALRLRMSASTPVHSTTNIAVHVYPMGATDAFPDDNAVTFEVYDEGSSSLRTSVTAETSTIRNGERGTVTVTIRVRNAGPDVDRRPQLDIRATGALYFRRISIPSGYKRGHGPTKRFAVLPGRIPAGKTLTVTLRVAGNRVGGTGHITVIARAVRYSLSYPNACVNIFPRTTVRSGRITVTEV